VLLLATGCGGGDENPIGPGDGEAPVGEYELVALGRIELPAHVQVEDCITTRFYGGRLRLSGNGTWQMEIGFSDDNYDDATASDEGGFEQQGATVWLTSGYSGVAHQGTLDGRVVRIMYDWCFNGVPDVQLVMAR
jgi:hypothetical protein